MKKLLVLLGINFQDALDSRGRMFVWFLLAIINPLTLLIFWNGAFKESATLIHGWNTSSVTTYYLFLMLANTLLHVHVEETVAQIDINEGRLAIFLLKPYSYLRFKLLGEFAYRLFQSSFSITVLVFIYIFFPQTLILDFSIVNLSLIFLIFTLAFSISFLFKMILGLTTFWMTDYHGLQEIVFVVLLVLAGFVMPLEFYPPAISTLAHFTPFPYMIYYPVVILQGNLQSLQIFKIVISQMFWIIALYLTYRVVWILGIKKFTAVGI